MSLTAWKRLPSEGTDLTNIDLGIILNWLSENEEFESEKDLFETLGAFYESRFRYDDAEEIYNNILKEQKLATAKTLIRLGQMQQKQEKFVKAEDAFATALKFRKEFLEESHLDVVEAMSCLDGVRTKSITETNEMLTTADTQHSLGKDFFNQKKYAEAETFYKKALEIR